MVHGHLLVFLLLSMPLTLVTPILQQVLGPGDGALPDASSSLSLSYGFQVNTLVDLVLVLTEVAAWSLVAAGATHGAYRFRTGQSVSIAAAYATMVRVAFPLVPIMLITGVGIILGLVALIVPGLYLNALWFVIVPAVVVERRGFAAITRSADLTAGYRWPLVGLLVVYFLILIVVSVAFEFVMGLVNVPLLSALGDAGGFVIIMLTGLLDAYFYAIGAVLAAEAYARLVDIKEGVTAQELASVFE